MWQILNDVFLFGVCAPRILVEESSLNPPRDNYSGPGKLPQRMKGMFFMEQGALTTPVVKNSPRIPSIFHLFNSLTRSLKLLPPNISCSYDRDSRTTLPHPTDVACSVLTILSSLISAVISMVAFLPTQNPLFYFFFAGLHIQNSPLHILRPTEDSGQL
jgi:hypothetical protein